MQSNKALPADVDAEKAILGAILLNNDLIDQASDLLDGPDLFLKSHRRIFDAMLALKASQNPIELVTLRALLTDKGQFDSVGGATYISSLIDGVARTDTIEHYARIVKYYARRRAVIRLCYSSMAKAWSKACSNEDFEALLETHQQRLGQIHSASSSRDIAGFYDSLDSLFLADLKEPEEIIKGVHRGEVAALDAVTNYGKSTLLLNVALALAAGQKCLPLVSTDGQPRTVCYFDFESPPTRLREDVRTMLNSIGNAALARMNFKVMVDATIKDEPLCLSRAEHFRRAMAWVKECKADLILIDTVASGFEVEDENNNAQVTRRVLNPLKRMARECDAGVLFSHHIGKASETQTAEGAYKGRGASAFGALPRIVFTLEKEKDKGSEYVVLACQKVKGSGIEPTLLKLNHESRWFEVCDEKPQPKAGPPTASEISLYVKQEGEARTGDICGHYKDRAARRTLEERVREAERLGLIWKDSQKDPWRFRNGQQQPLPSDQVSPEESTVIPFPQSANTIRDCGNADTEFKREPGSEMSDCPSCGAAGLVRSHCDRCGEFIRG
jgi:replicative DNA helicase